MTDGAKNSAINASPLDQLYHCRACSSWLLSSCWQKARSLGNANSTNVSTQVVPPPTAGTVSGIRQQLTSENFSTRQRTVTERNDTRMLNNVEENWQAPHKITQRPDHQHLGRQSSRRFHSSHSAREDGKGASDHLTRCVHPAPPMRRFVSPIRIAHALSPISHAPQQSSACRAGLEPPCSHPYQSGPPRSLIHHANKSSAKHLRRWLTLSLETHPPHAPSPPPPSLASIAPPCNLLEQ